MKKIDWDKGFIGLDGRYRSREDIEKWYLKKIFKHQKSGRHGYKDIIRRRLGDMLAGNKYGRTGQIIVSQLILKLKDILVAPPVWLEDYRKKYDRQIKQLKSELKKNGSKETVNGFNEAILNAFNYMSYRSTLLVWLAAKINIKCCPYCNMHYTLIVPRGSSGMSGKMITEFQFDHFFSKSKYPLLSMSLYNLIPACANCNLSKSDKHLSIELHPYHIDLHSKFRFEIADGELELLQMKRPADRLKIRLVPEDPKDGQLIGDYDKEFNIEPNYSRHRDIVQEINDGIYLQKYYEADNFRGLNIDFNILETMHLHKRLLLGGISDSEDIGKFPLSKFRHDIYRYLNRLMI